LGAVLACVAGDNRAFCKYACPVTVFLRAGNRFSLLEMTGTREGCTRCGACDRVCPMDVKVSSSVNRGLRVLDAECTLCQSCAGPCPQRNLRLSIGLDASTERSG
jgi:ferredoxin-type protein NapH